MMMRLVPIMLLLPALVLAGGSRLEERFASAKLESFNQRVAARCYLEPLSHDETADYVRAQLSAAGAAPDGIFTEAALTAIHRAADGIPRLINQVADHALVLAAAGGQPCIDADGINEAWSDLQQLPAVLTATAADDQGSASSHVVEFGSLDDGEYEPAPVGVATAVAEGPPSGPSERLDQIERHMAEFQQEMSPDGPGDAQAAGDQFDPVSNVLPEVDLVFDEAENPFA